jgi:hypothetical protein
MIALAGCKSRRVLSRCASTIALNVLALSALSIAASAQGFDYYGYGYGATTYGPQPMYGYSAPASGQIVYVQEPSYSIYGPPVYRRVVREYRSVVVRDPSVEYYGQAYGPAYGQAYGPAYGQTYGQAYGQVVDPGYRVVETPRYAEPIVRERVVARPVVRERIVAQPVVRERIVTQYRDFPYEPFGAIEPFLNYPPVWNEVVEVDEYGAAPGVPQVYRNNAGIYGRYGIYEGRAVDPGVVGYRRW